MQVRIIRAQTRGFCEWGPAKIRAARDRDPLLGSKQACDVLLRGPDLAGFGEQQFVNFLPPI